jgi:hypothetical protein
MLEVSFVDGRRVLRESLPQEFHIAIVGIAFGKAVAYY